jgi:hypothetical protein
MKPLLRALFESIRADVLQRVYQVEQEDFGRKPVGETEAVFLAHDFSHFETMWRMRASSVVGLISVAL